MSEPINIDSGWTVHELVLRLQRFERHGFKNAKVCMLSVDDGFWCVEDVSGNHRTERVNLYPYNIEEMRMVNSYHPNLSAEEEAMWTDRHDPVGHRG